MGTVITTARDGLLPSATAWQEAEFSLDGSRGFSEGTVCTSVGSVKGINQRLVTTARSCTQAVGLKGQGEKEVQADPVRAGVIKEGFLDRSCRGEGHKHCQKHSQNQDRAEVGLSLLAPFTPCCCFPLAPEMRGQRACVNQPIGSVPQGAGICREWVWGRPMVRFMEGLDVCGLSHDFISLAVA